MQRLWLIYDDKEDLPDRENNAKRKAKQKRYNNGDLVPIDLGPGVDESASSLEPHFTFLLLPVAESEIVVVGPLEPRKLFFLKQEECVLEIHPLQWKDMGDLNRSGNDHGLMIVSEPKSQRQLADAGLPTGLVLPRIPG